MVGHAPFGGNGALSVGVMRDSEKAYLFRVCSSSDGAIVTVASQGSKISPGQRHSSQHTLIRYQFSRTCSPHHLTPPYSRSKAAATFNRRPSVGVSTAANVRGRSRSDPRGLSDSDMELCIKKTSVLPVTIGSRCCPFLRSLVIPSHSRGQ